MGCVPCCFACRKLQSWKYRIASVVVVWTLPVVLWLAYSPLSVCSPRIVHSYPMRHVSDDGVWESYWCTRPCRTAVHRPASIDDVAHAVRGAARVRALGAGHSTTDLQCVDDDVENSILLTVDDLCYLKGVDANGVATFGAGCTIFWAQEQLATLHGRQLRGYGSITNQRLGGALSTSLHGQHPQPFANYATGVAAVLADGSFVNLTKGVDDAFHAWPGSNGMLGVLVEVRLQTVPLEVVECASADGDADAFQVALTASPAHPGFEAKVMYRDGILSNYIVRTCRTTDVTPPVVARLENKDSLWSGFWADNVLLAAAMFLGRLVPLVPGIDAWIYDASPSASSRRGPVLTIDDYRTEVSYTPHFDEEYSVPSRHCLAALREMGAAVVGGLTTHFYVRRVDASVGWLTWAPEDSCAIRLEFFRFSGNGVDDETITRKAVEGIALAYSGSGHFGKPWYSNAAGLLHNSPNVTAFEAYRNGVDPTDKFQNAFTLALRGRRIDDRAYVLPPELDVRLAFWRTGVSIAIVATAAAMLITPRRRHSLSLPREPTTSVVETMYPKGVALTMERDARMRRERL